MGTALMNIATKTFVILLVAVVAAFFWLLPARFSFVRLAAASKQTPPLADGEKQDAPILLPLRAPRIVVKKSARRLYLYSDERVVRTYRIGLGFNPVGDKKTEGDGCTPEGAFYIYTKNPLSNYHLSLGLSYPNNEDAERGLRDRLITKAQYNQIKRAMQNGTAPPQTTRLGGQIYIHGNGSRTDWTLGCIALENEEMKELFDAVPIGINITVEP